MESSSITVRYAKALFLTAQEKNFLEQVRDDVNLVEEMFLHVPEFNEIIKNPVIRPSLKIKALKSVFTGKMQPLTLGFVELLIKNKRELHLPAIIRQFMAYFRRSKALKSALVTTATALDETTRDEVAATIKKFFNTNIELTEKTDPKLIGGFIIKVDDMQLDASISSGLKKIKKQLINH
jgi:F-type H+-transporting ATPase subunit delta